MQSWFLFLFLLMTTSACAGETDARQLVKDAMDHWRGLTSSTEFTMTIHRPDWERKMTMRAWSEGTKLSLVRVIEPKKDAGNGTNLAQYQAAAQDLCGLGRISACMHDLDARS